MNILVVFRNDLRIRDNQTLLQAASNADTLICAYADDNETSPFVYEALAELQTQLRELDNDLLVQKKPLAEVIDELTKKYDIDEVYVQERPHPEELDSITQPIKTFETATLYNPNDLPIDIKDQETFLRLTQQLFPPLAFAAPSTLPETPLQDVARVHVPEHDQDVVGGEQEGQQVLKKLLEQGGDATALMKYIEIGCVSPRDVFYQALDTEQTTNKDFASLRFAMRQRDAKLFTN